MLRATLLWLFLILSAVSTQATNDTLQARLQAVVDGFLAENPQAPGISVHLNCPSRDLDWTAVAGREDRPTHAAILTPDHAFRIASNTKTYVAAGVLRLVVALMATD